jgi:hypothetical protein
MTAFSPFALAVEQRFRELSKHELYVVGTDNRAFEAVYLASFPEGTNPIHIKRPEHDCNCCKNFLRNIGNVVAIINGDVQTVWDVRAEEPYATVARSMAEYVRSLPVTDLFRSKQPTYGRKSTRQWNEDQTKVIRVWDHFWGDVQMKQHGSPTPDAPKGVYRTTVQVFQRGLEELSTYAVDAVLDLIDSKALYKGDEFRRAVVEFSAAKQAYVVTQNKSTFLWANATGPASRFRNSVIGTLVTDISSGTPIEDAVRAFEVKVAPANYKRPTAVITKKMADDALKTIKELDLEPSLARRFAKLTDVSVKDVLWVNRDSRKYMKGGLEDILASATKAKPVDTSKAQDISIADFMEKVLPSATELSVFFDSQLQQNLMTITAPVYEDTNRLFKWTNDFAWSYTGNLADSNIKERVKRAGGNVTSAKLRISLSWSNLDDLDIHVVEPNGTLIYFGAKKGRYGELDVDMNAGFGSTREAVENVAFTKVPDGSYKVKVNNYNQRETSNVGFVVEVESEGKVYHLTHQAGLRGRDTNETATLIVQDGKVVDIKAGPGIVLGGLSQGKWGVRTEEFAPVSTVMLSPNYWGDNSVGNKHTFFVLKDCKADEPMRGFYNEFLSSNLDKHRKVFEVLGNKTMCQPTDEQLSGLGFSSTKGDKVTVKVVSGSAQRAYTISF